MAHGTYIKILRKAGAFTNGDLVEGELGMDTTNDKLYGSKNGTTVFQVAGGIAALLDDTSPELAAALDAANFKITSLADPTSAADAATKSYVDAAILGMDWQESVIDIQTDSTLNPGSPLTGDRYILEDTANLHANFGTITGVGDNDIVEYDGTDFFITYDSSTNEGGATYDEDTDTTYVHNGTAWVTMTGGGVSNHGALTGLGNDDHTQYSLIATGTAAPTTTPARTGCIFVDTSADRVYQSVGSASSADWQLQVGPETTDTFKNKTISDSTNTIDGGTI